MEMSIPSFDLKVVQNDRTTRIAPAGELDIASAPEFEQAIADATSEPGAELVIDLRELTFMDSTGLRALAQTNARADEAGFALSIVRGPRQIERVLEISGLADLLPLVDAPPDGAGPAT
ncbi:MAG: anti-sigma factor antagonist [Solirubrobacteraceae bacterium]|jgi:anti-anti-sigma factor|nr:anti-sigma factor antagonist [Solirubrobacteraceae bacterium]